MICKNKGCARDIDADSVYCKWCGTRQVREKKTRGDAPTARRLPSGAWACRVRVGGADKLFTCPTKQEAVAAAMAYKHGLKVPAKEAPSITLDEAYDKYINARSGSISPSTEAGYKRLKRNTFQQLMQQQLTNITSEQIQREIGAMAKDGKSPKYIRNAEGLLASVLKQYAPEINFSVMLPQKQRVELRQLSDDEIGKVIKAFAGTVMELPVLMALWMGMRLSEIRGAKYEDIVDQRLHICRAVVLDADGKDVEKPPKTFSGDRWIYIPPHIQTLLSATGREAGRIVEMSGAAIYKRFVRGLDAAGIPRCRFHDLRHANAAVMVRLGIESKYAQERNGWASDRMYKQVYAYAMDDKMVEAAEKINTYFGNKMATQN